MRALQTTVAGLLIVIVCLLVIIRRLTERVSMAHIAMAPQALPAAVPPPAAAEQAAPAAPAVAPEKPSPAGLRKHVAKPRRASASAEAIGPADTAAPTVSEPA
ncbi:MAG TPA: hypothetical protein VEU62_06400, partial [Bryobacterales bacterium]|nr:hypothetical protein [Bryobacterales bacterium]